MTDTPDPAQEPSLDETVETSENEQTQQPEESKFKVVGRALREVAGTTKEFIDEHETKILQTSYAAGAYTLLDVANSAINEIPFHYRIIDGVAMGAMAILLSYVHKHAVNKTIKLLNNVQHRETEERTSTIDTLISDNQGDEQEEQAVPEPQDRSTMQKIVDFFSNLKNKTHNSLNDNRENIVKGAYIIGSGIAVPATYAILQNVNLGDYSIDTFITGGVAFLAVKAFAPLTTLISRYMDIKFSQNNTSQTSQKDTSEDQAITEEQEVPQTNNNYFSTVKDRTRTAIVTALTIGAVGVTLYVPGSGLLNAFGRVSADKVETAPQSMESFDMVEGLYPSSHGVQVKVIKIAGKEYRTEFDLSDEKGRKDYDRLYSASGHTIVNDPDGIVWSMSGQISKVNKIDKEENGSYSVYTLTDRGENIVYSGLRRTEVSQDELVKPGKIIGYLNSEDREATSLLYVIYSENAKKAKSQIELNPIFE